MRVFSTTIGRQSGNATDVDKAAENCDTAQTALVSFNDAFSGCTGTVFLLYTLYKASDTAPSHPNPLIKKKMTITLQRT